MTNLLSRKQCGVGLIEVLVTLLILSTSLLAMGALQSRSLQFNHGAYLRSQANIMAYDVFDRMRASRDDYENYSLDYGDDPTEDDIEAWLDKVVSALPGGEASIDCEEYTCTTNVRWIEQEDVPATSFDPSDPNTATFTYTTRI